MLSVFVLLVECTTQECSGPRKIIHLSVMWCISLLLNKTDIHNDEKHATMYHDLCPCFCNAHMAYEFRGGCEQPKTPEEWIEWWQSNRDYEEPFVSRPLPPVVFSVEEMDRVISLFTPTVQRVIVARMLPDYIKTPRNICVGSLPPQIYSHWLSVIGRHNKPIGDTSRKSGIPTHTTRRPHQLLKTTWAEAMPDLGPQWHLKKWIGPLGHVNRARVLELSITHNTFNNLIFVNFTYETEFNDGNKWNFC